MFKGYHLNNGNDINELFKVFLVGSSLVPALIATCIQTLPLCLYSHTVHNWCAKWHIHLQLKDIADEANILSDMHNLCDTTRMIAVASIALLAEQEAITEDKLKAVPLKDSYSSMRLRSQVRVLPQLTEKMVVELCRLLDDTAEHVRVPSAVVLYCIDRQNQKVCVKVYMYIHVNC